MIGEFLPGEPAFSRYKNPKSSRCGRVESGCAGSFGLFRRKQGVLQCDDHSLAPLEYLQ
jgi:hypothetical protein